MIVILLSDRLCQAFLVDISFVVVPFAGEFRAGHITFYMSLSVNISDLKPHIPELAQNMAKELDVNASQVI